MVHRYRSTQVCRGGFAEPGSTWEERGKEGHPCSVGRSGEGCPPRAWGGTGARGRTLAKGPPSARGPGRRLPPADTRHRSLAHARLVDPRGRTLGGGPGRDTVSGMWAGGRAGPRAARAPFAGPRLLAPWPESGHWHRAASGGPSERAGGRGSGTGRVAPRSYWWAKGALVPRDPAYGVLLGEPRRAVYGFFFFCTHHRKGTPRTRGNLTFWRDRTIKSSRFPPIVLSTLVKSFFLCKQGIYRGTR